MSQITKQYFNLSSLFNISQNNTILTTCPPKVNRPNPLSNKPVTPPVTTSLPRTQPPYPLSPLPTQKTNTTTTQQPPCRTQFPPKASAQDDPNKPKIEAMLIESEKLGKYLSSNSNIKSWLISTISQICAREEKQPGPYPFLFEPTEAAARHNSNIIRNHKFNYKKAVKANRQTVISLGSEFRSIDSIK